MELPHIFMEELSAISDKLSEISLLIEKNNQKVPIPYEENCALIKEGQKLEFRKIQLQECASFSESECYRLELNKETKTTEEMESFIQSRKKTIIIPYCCRIYYRSYNGTPVSFILSDKLRTGRNEEKLHVTISRIKNIDYFYIYGHITPKDNLGKLKNIICDTLDSIEPIQEKTIIPLNEPVYILAQSKMDRHGFKTIQRGNTLYEKKYGDGPLYPIIGLLIHS